MLSFFLRGCYLPTVIVVDPELMAQSMGLGTLWDGIAKMMFNALPNLAYDLGIPKDHLFGYVMAFGKPSVKYYRTVERGSANVKLVNCDFSSKN